MKPLGKFPNTLVPIIIFIFGTICIIGTGGGGGGSSDSETPQSIETFSIESDEVGISYSISVGLPPNYKDSGIPHAAIFLLDGNWFFNDLYESYDEDDDFILIGINNTHRRDIDYLPFNTCGIEGGGNTNFLDFLVNELVPYLDSEYNIDPSLRLLFGHSMEEVLYSIHFLQIMERRFLYYFPMMRRWDAGLFYLLNKVITPKV